MTERSEVHTDGWPADPDMSHSMMSKHSISLVIPTYNREALLGETIEAAMAQSTPFREVIVIDDGSTDGSEASVSKFANHIIYAKQKNQGVQAARNAGVALATGEYVAFCDSDDLLCTDFGRSVSEALASLSGVDALYCNFANFSGEQVWPDKFSQAPAGWFDGATKMDDVFVDMPDLFLQVLAYQPLFPTGMVVSKRFYRSLGGFRTEFRGVGAEDWEFTLRVISNGRVGLIANVVSKIRRHAGNDSASSAYMAEGESVVLADALQNNVKLAKYSAQIQSSIGHRQLTAFNGYFAAGRFSDAVRVATNMKSRPLSMNLMLKRIIVSCPDSIRTVLWKAFQAPAKP